MLRVRTKFLLRSFQTKRVIMETAMMKIFIGLSPYFICIDESPLKTMKDAFYFILEDFSLSTFLQFCLDLLVTYKKRSRLET